MSTITVINGTDTITSSRSVINTNFANLNTDKMEKSANLSDVANANTSLNNLLPDQTGNSGKILQTDGSDTSWADPSGSPLATQSTQGITALTVAAADPLLPKAVGDNDPRMPTQAMRDAMAGTGTPSSSNKFVTADTDALKELLANKSTTTTLGTSDTLYPTQNAVKTYVDTNNSVGKTGVFTKDISSNTTTTIAHGLGKTPKILRLTVMFASELASNVPGVLSCHGVYDGSTQGCVFIGQNTSASPSPNRPIFSGNSATKIAHLSWYSANDAGNSAFIEGVASFDGTNITITWTVTNSPSSTVNCIWEVQ